MNPRLSLCPFTALLCIAGGIGVCASSALANPIFDITYDSSLSSYANLTQVQSAVNYVTNQYSSDFSNNVTINITVAGMTSGLGESSTPVYEGFSYSTVRSALLAQTPSDAANLPATDPTSGGSFAVTSANGKAIGLLPASSASDGTFSFNTNLNYTFDPANRAVAGEYDFIGVVEHEFSEIMGRITTLTLSGPQYDPLDMFRYSAPGVRSFSTASNAEGNAVSAYFSIDNGATNLMAYNDITGGDLQDWAGQNQNSYDAFSPMNSANLVTPIDLQVMNSIGYAAVPEPSSIVLAGLGTIAICAVAARRRKC